MDLFLIFPLACIQSWSIAVQSLNYQIGEILLRFMLTREWEARVIGHDKPSGFSTCELSIQFEHP